MSDLFQHLPAPLNPPNSSVGGSGRVSANGKRIGRPPGARNKGSLDLARYIEATFGGMTPGQQLAELTMVKPADLKRARADARELGIIDVDLPLLTLAMVVKAARLAKALGCDKLEAWGMLAAERAKLMPFVHQAQPQARPSDPHAALPTIFLADRADFDAAASSPQLGGPDADIVDDFEMVGEQVSQPKSHDAA
jgi:hypothetical protein